MNAVRTILATAVVMISACTVIALALVIPSSGTRDTSKLESIYGISYPEDVDGTRVLEKLAHADVYLKESVLGKQLRVTFEYNPGNTTNLALGVRENSFWLSYPKQEFWTPSTGSGWHNAELVFPLTDKIQEPNRSIDIMFFSQTETSTTDVYEGVEDSVDWRIRNLQARIEPARPTYAEMKDFVRALLSQERAL